MDMVQRMNGNNNKFAQLTQSMSCPWYCMWVDGVVGLMLSLTFTASSRPSKILKD